MKQRILAIWLIGAIAVARGAHADCSATCAAGACTFDGIHNAGLGAGALSVDGSCRLVVGGIGSSWLDGVVQDGLASVYMVTELATPNFSLSGLGTAAQIRQIGVVNGVSGREISTSRVINVSGSTIRMDMDCGAIAVAAYSTEIYSNGALVYAQPPNINPPVLLFPKGDMVAMACALLTNGDLYTTVSFGGDVPFTLQTPSGNLGPFTGQCVKLRGFSPALLPTLQEAIENRFKNTGPVTIASLFAGSLPASERVCLGAPVPARARTWGAVKMLYR